MIDPLPTKTKLRQQLFMKFDSGIPTVQTSYRTQNKKPDCFSRLCPSMSFACKVSDIVLRASDKAKRGAYGDREWCHSSFEITNALEEIGATIVVEGLEHIHSFNGPCVFIGNHMSTLETFVLPYLIRPHKPVTFVVKKALVEMPVFSHVMISRDPVVVGRKSPKEDLLTVLNEGAKRLQEGISLIVFPQTTRTTAFDAEKFNSIGVKIAKRAKVPVIPIALKTDAWGNGKLIKDFGKIDPSKTIHFKFGEPLTISGNGSIQNQATIDFISQQLDQWKQEAPQA